MDDDHGFLRRVPRIESPQLRVWEIDFGVYSEGPHISDNSLKTLLYLAKILVGNIQIPSNPRMMGYDTHHIVLLNLSIFMHNLQLFRSTLKKEEEGW